MVTAEMLLDQFEEERRVSSATTALPPNWAAEMDDTADPDKGGQWLVSRYGFTNGAVLDGVATAVHSMKVEDGHVAVACLIDGIAPDEASEDVAIALDSLTDSSIDGLEPSCIVEPNIPLDSFVIGSLGSLSVAA